MADKPPPKGRGKSAGASQDKKPAPSQKGKANEEKKPKDAEKKSQLPSIKLQHSLTLEKRKYVNTVLGYEPEERGGAHSHPLLALERRLAREYCRDYLGQDKYVLNIGGKPEWWATNKARGPTVHNLCPIIDAADKAREVQRKLASEKTELLYCNCRMEDVYQGRCTHLTAKPDCLLSVHSVYYLGADAFGDAILATNMGFALVVAHVYPTPKGEMAHGEMCWTREGDSLKVMCSGGAVYNHAAPDWLLTGTLQGTRHTLNAYPFRDFGTNRVFIITVVDQGAVENSMSFADAVASATHFGSMGPLVDRRGILRNGDKPVTAGYDVFDVTSGKYYSLGPYIKVVFLTKETVLVPKSVVAAVANFMMYNERTPQSFGEAVRRARDAVRKINMDDTESDRALLYAAIIGFTMNVEQETRLMNSIDHAALGAHADARMFRTSGAWRFWTLSWGIPCSATRAARNTGLVSIPDVCFEGRDYKPLAQDCTIDIRSEGQCKPKVGMTKIGPAMALSISRASVARNCACNRVIAIRNRGINKVALAEEGAWDKAIDALKAMSPHLFGAEEIKATSWEEWVGRFPASRQNMLRRDRRRTSTVTEMTINAFVKREVICKEEYDPRLIQGTDLAYQNQFGPIQHAFQHEMATRSRLVEGRDVRLEVVFTCGLTGEDIGAAWKALTSKYPTHIAVCNDFRRYDTTCDSTAQRAAANAYRAAGMSARGVELAMMQVGTKRGVMGEIRYTMAGRTCSGVPDTYIKGSILNAASIAHALAGESADHRYAALISGDDSIALIPRSVQKVFLAAFPVERPNKLGLVVSDQKVLESNDPAIEFCSQYFWRVDDDTLVLGPKPGRQIAKLFLSVGRTHKPEKAARETALGYLETASVVPVLADLVFRVLKLTEGIKAKPKVDKYKHRASLRHEVTQVTIAQFCSLYGCSIAEYSAVRDIVANCSLNDWLDTPLLRRMFAVDSGATEN